ncbi:MAG: FmdB family zinc ribbon protein [Anaerolineales bacterium]
MPVYTYRCQNCGHEFDRQQNFSDHPLKACPNCRKHSLLKVYRSAGVVFKGSGFYVTDKRKSSGANGRTQKTKESDSGEKKTEAAGDQKKEAKSEKPKPAAQEG